jgi:uncharacterized protein YrrD
MFKGRDVIGKSVIAYDDGKKFAEVNDLIFDHDSHQLLGFLLREAGWFRPAQVLLFSDVQAIGIDAVITSSRGAIAQASQPPAVSHILDHRTMLKGTRMLTIDGRDLGVIVDLYFSETSGQVEGYEVSGGVFADAYSGHSLVPALQTLKIGRDVAFVPTETARLMKGQGGGVNAAVQDTIQSIGNKIYPVTQAIGKPLHAPGHAASASPTDAAPDAAPEATPNATPVTTERLQHLGRFTNEPDQDVAEAAKKPRHGLGRPAIVSPTHAITDPAGQKNFVAGRTLERDVITNRGSALAIRGQPITHEIADAAQALGLLDDLYRATGGCWSVSN